MNYEEYSPRWQEEVGALADRIFGTGYFIKPSEIAREPETCIFVCLAEKDRLAGFAQGRVLPRLGLRDFLEHRLEIVPPDLEEADALGSVGVLQTVAVDPEHRGNGVGTKLLTIVHDVLVGRGGDKLIATFKRGPASSQVEGIMERLGFEFWNRLGTYWRDACDQGTFKCVDRTERCNCEALFFRKIVY